jgi:hypothetical protein
MTDHIPPGTKPTVTSNPLGDLLRRLREDGGRYLLSVVMTREERNAQPEPTFGGKGHLRWLTEEEYAALCALAPSDETCEEPSAGLLMSMAIRMDHGLGVPGYYDQPMFGSDGPTQNQRLEAALSTARQMWEEVTGRGFYRPEKEAEYVKRAALKATALHVDNGSCPAADVPHRGP